MKKLAAGCAFLLLLTPQLFAPWAAHLVITPAAKITPAGAAKPRDRHAETAAELARAVSVAPGPGGQITITIDNAKDGGPNGKGYYLVLCKKRRAGDELDLRPVLQSWKRRNSSDPAVNAAVTKALAKAAMGDSLAGIVEVRPLQPVQRNGSSIVEVALDRNAAMTSYFTWDFKVIYDRGAMIMDGGLWVTYDLPVFIEAGGPPPKHGRK